jgi:uncharacterized protein YegL
MKNFICLMVVAIASTVCADDYVVIVLDTSGSMADNIQSVGKSRMEVAKEALISVLSKIPNSTKVGILTFNGWAYDLQTIDHQKLFTAITSASPSGSTPLYACISEGTTRLLNERQNQGNVGSYKLLVVTDGAASDDWLNKDSRFRDGSEKPGVLKDVLNRSITVDAIGLDMSEQHALSTQINGTYMRGDDPNSLSKAITKSVAEVGFTSQDASEESFKEISDLPESFVLASLKGLTTFSNQPIGELPLIESIQEDGTTVLVQNPNSETEDMGFLKTLFVILTVVVVIVFVVGFIVSHSHDRGY